MYRPLCLVSAVLVLTAGCSSDRGKFPVSGQVTFRGQPLDQGTIEFHKPEVAGPTATAMIRSGKFSIPGEQGLAPGTYRVVIRSPEVNPNSGNLMAGGQWPVNKERIPASYNTESKVTVEVAHKSNTFEFTID